MRVRILLCALALAVTAAAAPIPDSTPGAPPEDVVLRLDEAQVHRLQRALGDVGLFRGETTGRYDAATDQAMTIYRRDAGLPLDAPIDSESLARLEQRAEAATLLSDLQQARAAEIERARAALLADRATRDLVGGGAPPADPTRDASQCLAAPSVRCLLAEASESAKAVSDTQRRDWAFAEILAVQTRAGLGADALVTLRHIEDPRRILRALRDIAVSQAAHGELAAAVAAAARIPDEAVRGEALNAIAGLQAATATTGGDAPTIEHAAGLEPRFRAIDLIDLAMVRIDAHDAPGAQALLEEGAHTIAAVDKPHRREYPRFRLALARLALAEQTASAQEAHDAVAALSEPHLRAQAYALLSALQQRLGEDPGAAESAAEEAIGAIPSRLRRIWTAADIAMTLKRDGATATAEHYLEIARETAATYQSPWGRARALARLADAYLLLAEDDGDGLLRP